MTENDENESLRESLDRRARYEYRVSGKHPSARKQLAGLADESTRERVNDCYLLVDDVRWNAKVRDNTLKIKQLIQHDDGFQRWARGRHLDADSTPSPFDEIFALLRLDRPQRGKSYDLRTAVKALDEVPGVRAVFVTKDRRRYRIGSLRAEVTDVVLRETDEVLHTVSVEGDDPAELAALLRRLGLDAEPNIALHEVIDAESSN